MNPDQGLPSLPHAHADADAVITTRIEIAQLKESMPESTMIYVTRDQVEAMTLATRIVVLANKGIAQVGTPPKKHRYLPGGSILPNCWARLRKYILIPPRANRLLPSCQALSATCGAQPLPSEHPQKKYASLQKANLYIAAKAPTPFHG